VVAVVSESGFIRRQSPVRLSSRSLRLLLPGRFRQRRLLLLVASLSFSFSLSLCSRLPVPDGEGRHCCRSTHVHHSFRRRSTAAQCGGATLYDPSISGNTSLAIRVLEIRQEKEGQGPFVALDSSHVRHWLATRGRGVVVVG
jgi:hypothetical protein